MSEFEIAGRKIGPDYPPYIIAEISANHNGDINKALRLIEIAKECGADAVKIQTYTADTMTLDCDSDQFKIKGGLWDGYTLYKLYEEAHTPWEWHKAMFEKAKDIGITLFSTPFDETAVDFLEKLDTPAYKIASFEATDIPLIEYIAQKGKPIVLSTGMADFDEITEAIEAIKKYHDKLVVLHCVSSYPAPPEQSNLKTIADIGEKFGVIPGLSDHTLGTATATTSVALGACVIEKHFIDDRSDEGPDSSFSLEPHELKTLVDEANIAFRSIGTAGYARKKAEEANVVFRRSIYFVKDMNAGDIITKDCIRRIRPGYGLAPKYYNQILGKKVKVDIKSGTATSYELIFS